MYLPFFLVAHIIAILTGFQADGFSLPYQWSLMAGSIFITATGFVFLQNLLKKYFSNLVVNVVILCIYFGTNMTVHASMYGTNLMTHNYLFALYTVLMTLSEKYKRTLNIKYWYWSIACSGVMALVRPVEIVSILIPLLWTKNNPVINFFKASRKSTFPAIIKSLLILLAIGSIQFIYWKIETGNWMIYSYNNAGEGLDLLNPHLIDYLFSFRKGWIIYTPLVIIAVVGFYYLYKNNKGLFYPTLFIFLISLYIASSWSVWWYSGSFSSRAAIPAYSYLFFPMCAFFQYLIFSKRNIYLKTMITSLVLSLVALNIFQTWQYHKGIIHPERMTKAAYFLNFLKLNKHPETDYHLLIPRLESGDDDLNENIYFTRRIIGYEDMEFGSDSTYTNDPVYEGKNSQRITGGNFSKHIWAPFNGTTTHYYAYLRISCYVYIPSTIAHAIKVSLCAEMQHKGKIYFWKALNFENLNIPREEWTYIEYIYLTPEVRSQDDLFKSYLWNRETTEIYIDQLQLETFY